MPNRDVPRVQKGARVLQWAARAVFFAAFVGCGSGNGSGASVEPATSQSSGGSSPTLSTGGAAGDAPCTPGDIEACACPAPATGQHLCDSTGQFEACVCRAPAGSLVCAGQQCRGGGTCDPTGGCPAFLADCFTNASGFANCDTYCQAQGFMCALSSCGPDGTGYAGGYTWVSYAALDPNACPSYGTTGLVSMDECTTPIWLSPSLSADAVIRCCCQQ